MTPKNCDMKELSLMTEKNGAKEKIMNEALVRMWQIGGDGTEYFAAHSEEEVREYYTNMVGKEQAEEDFESGFEELPQSKMDTEFEFDDDGVKTKTTWRKLIEEGPKIPCQISSGYL